MPVALARVALRRTLTTFAIAARAAARAALQCPTAAPIVTDTSSDPDVMTYMSQCAAKARPGRLCYARLPASCPPTYTFQSTMSLTRHSFPQQPGRPGPTERVQTAKGRHSQPQRTVNRRASTSPGACRGPRRARSSMQLWRHACLPSPRWRYRWSGTKPMMASAHKFVQSHRSFITSMEWIRQHNCP